jgi:hypothetical protein
MKKLKILPLPSLISIGTTIYLLSLLVYWFVAFEPFTHDFVKLDSLQRFFYLLYLVMLIPISVFVRDAVPILYKLGKTPRIVECPRCKGTKQENFNHDLYVYKVPCRLCKEEGTIAIYV